MFCFDLLNCVYNRLFYTEVAHGKNIDSHYVYWFMLFEQLVSIFASWTADRLFGWLFSYLFSLVDWSVGFGWLAGWLVSVHSGAVWLFAWPVDRRTRIISLLGFIEHKSSADHRGWQPGCKWTSQIWNVAHCLGALSCNQCTYTYDTLKLLRKVICFYSWIDKLLIFSVILVWQLVENKFYKLLSRSVRLPMASDETLMAISKFSLGSPGVVGHNHKQKTQQNAFGRDVLYLPDLPTPNAPSKTTLNSGRSLLEWALLNSCFREPILRSLTICVRVSPHYLMHTANFDRLIAPSTCSPAERGLSPGPRGMWPVSRGNMMVRGERNHFGCRSLGW